MNMAPKFTDDSKTNGIKAGSNIIATGTHGASISPRGASSASKAAEAAAVAPPPGSAAATA